MTHSITGVKREGEIELKEESDGTLTIGFVESYHVLATSKDVQMWEVMRDAVPTVEARQYLPVNGLPLPSVTVSIDRLCVCKTLTGKREEGNPLKWVFTATWSSKVQDGPTTTFGGNPGVDPETIIVPRETLFEPVQRFNVKDLQNRPYVNGAGSLYNPPITIDDELARWDFTQFEPVYPGTYTQSDLSETIAGLNGTIGILTQGDLVDGKAYPPGVYKKISGVWTFIATTDNTATYFNGCTNLKPFNGYPAFSLLLKVRKSTEGMFWGVRRRISQYSIIHDVKNHWDKPLNAGPYFVERKLDAEGGLVEPAEFVKYPYIYFTKDVEDEATDLVVDETGPLGSRNLELAYDEDDTIVRGDFDDETDGVPTNGAVKVTTADGAFTYRATRPTANDPMFHIEYMNRDVLDFNLFLRVR